MLLEWLIEGAIVAALATMLVGLVPSRYAAQRHALLWLALVCILALPLSAWLPAGAIGTGATGPAPSTSSRAVVIPPLPDWIAGLIMLFWAGAAAVALVRLVRALVHVRRMTFGAEPLGGTLEAQMARLAHRRQFGRQVRIVSSDAIDGACAVGFVAPRIVVSRRLVEELDRDDLEAVLLHEYAHLQRFDDWTRLAERTLLVVAGPHPAVRWIVRQIHVECEAACDRLAADWAQTPAQYLRALTRVIEIGVARDRTSQLAPAVFVRPGGLHARVRRVLVPARVGPAVAKLCALAAAIVVVAVAAGTALMPPLVATASVDQTIAEIASVPLPLLRKAGVDALRSSFGDEAREGTGDRHVAHRGQSQSGSMRENRSLQQVPAVQPAAPASGGGPEPAGPLPSDEPAAVVAVDPAPLTSVALPQLVHRASTPHEEAAPAPEFSWGAFGAGLGQAGANTGGAASRAGSAIGRAFKRGGLAIAGSF